MAEGTRLVRMSDALMIEIRKLSMGAHVHLTDLIPNAPSPGSIEWMPIVEAIAAELDSSSGRWIVKLPLGTVEAVPADVLPGSVHSLVELGSILEPPSVTHCLGQHQVARWEGANHRWQRVFGIRSLVVISVSRSVAEASEGDPFVCEQLWEIQSST